ncbi:hypothetical protein [Oceanobacillus manasiensis]|uniref:hypothetical protein n=1 Tax=Oceanobacillus manasiensis TaxID=586413 RepID=UPI000AE9325C|nr:hypothetical protein [Oceanobacillus manasiensis]
MEIIFMFVAGFVVFFIAIIAVMKGIIHRVKEPARQSEQRISNLEKRLQELESRKTK